MMKRNGVNRTDSFDFGQRIRSLRLLRGESQEQLALRAGITPAYLGMVERGEKNPTLLTIEKLCSALGISLEECFSNSAQVLDCPSDISRQILLRLQTMELSEQQAVLKILDQICVIRALASTQPSGKEDES